VFLPPIVKLDCGNFLIACSRAARVSWNISVTLAVRQ
jgi:hypothetical protein